MNATIWKVAVTPSDNCIARTWWSTTSLSLRYAQTPYGPSRSACTRPASSVASVTWVTGQTAPFSRSVGMYSFSALYGQSCSTAQSRHRSAEPAGAFSGRKCFSPPKPVTCSIRPPMMYVIQSRS